MAEGAEKKEEVVVPPVTATPGSVVDTSSKGGKVPPVVVVAPVGAGATGTESKAVKLKDDEEIPDNADLIELSSKALKGRLTRHTNKELKARFGTDDFDEIKLKLSRLDELESKEEERRRAALDEATRLQEDVAKANARAEAAELRVKQSQETRMVDKEETRIIKLGANHMDPDEIEDQLPKLARYLKKTFSEKQLAKLKDSDIEEWFQKRVEEKPKLGKNYGVVTAPPEEKKPEKKPLSNGLKNEERPTQAKTEEKTFAPGRANSMTSAEAKANAAKQGLRW